MAPGSLPWQARAPSRQNPGWPTPRCMRLLRLAGAHTPRWLPSDRLASRVGLTEWSPGRPQAPLSLRKTAPSLCHASSRLAPPKARDWKTDLRRQLLCLRHPFSAPLCCENGGIRLAVAAVAARPTHRFHRTTALAVALAAARAVAAEAARAAAR
eukprot:539686-Prymnesium_polylepis.1